MQKIRKLPWQGEQVYQSHSAGGSVGNAGSFIACIIFISATFFASFKILYFNLSM